MDRQDKDTEVMGKALQLAFLDNSPVKIRKFMYYDKEITYSIDLSLINEKIELECKIQVEDELKANAQDLVTYINAKPKLAFMELQNHLIIYRTSLIITSSLRGFSLLQVVIQTLQAFCKKFENIIIGFITFPYELPELQAESTKNYSAAIASSNLIRVDFESSEVFEKELNLLVEILGNPCVCGYIIRPGMRISALTREIYYENTRFSSSFLELFAKKRAKGILVLKFFIMNLLSQEKLKLDFEKVMNLLHYKKKELWIVPTIPLSQFISTTNEVLLTSGFLVKYFNEIDFFKEIEMKNSGYFSFKDQTKSFIKIPESNEQHYFEYYSKYINLRHQNLIRVFGLKKHRESCYIVTEKFERKSFYKHFRIHSIINQGTGHSEQVIKRSKSVEYLIQLCDLICYLERTKFEFPIFLCHKSLNFSDDTVKFIPNFAMPSSFLYLAPEEIGEQLQIILSNQLINEIEKMTQNNTEFIDIQKLISCKSEIFRKLIQQNEKIVRSKKYFFLDDLQFINTSQERIVQQLAKDIALDLTPISSKLHEGEIYRIGLIMSKILFQGKILKFSGMSYADHAERILGEKRIPLISPENQEANPYLVQITRELFVFRPWNRLSLKSLIEKLKKSLSSI